jgi:hypothetical protein
VCSCHWDLECSAGDVCSCDRDLECFAGDRCVVASVSLNVLQVWGV